jgi:hypothetical protein
MPIMTVKTHEFELQNGASFGMAGAFHKRFSVQPIRITLSNHRETR